MRIRTVTLLGICVIAVAVAAFEVFRTAAPSNGSEFARLAAYDLKDGRKEAEADLISGHPRWITYGGPAFDVRPGALILDRRLGLQRDHIAFCAATPGAERYAREYNRVIFDRVASQYGRDFVVNELRAAEISPWIEEEANQSSQRNAMAWPISVFETSSSRG